MSVIVCEQCRAYVDTDEVPAAAEWSLCERCLEKHSCKECGVIIDLDSRYGRFRLCRPCWEAGKADDEYDRRKDERSARPGAGRGLVQ